MERSPGREVPVTTSLQEEPTSPPGVALRCGNRTSHSHRLSSSDPPALTRDTVVCLEATELINGVNHSRPATQGTHSKDTTTTTQHTIKANTLNNTLLLPLTKALDKIAILTTSRFSFLTFPSNYDYQVHRTLTFSRSSTSSFARTAVSPVFSGAWTDVSSVFLFCGLSECSQYTDGITPSYRILADLSIVHERISY